MFTKWRNALLSIALFATSACASTGFVQHELPILAIETAEMVIFLEGSRGLKPAVEILDATLSIQSGDEHYEYQIVGEGRLEIFGNLCSYQEGLLTCDKELISAEQGGVLFFQDGTIRSVNPLAMMAR